MQMGNGHSNFKRLQWALAGAVMAMGTSAPALAQSGVDFVFIVDESGSMSGEQAFIPTLVSDLDAAFTAAGFSDNRFGLVGFGDSSVAARLVAPFGTAADIATAAGTLTVSGGFEDGYDGIQFSFDNFTLRPDVGQFLLITDEDRDIFNSSVDFASILGEFQSNNTGLNGIYDVGLITTIPGVTPGAAAPQDGTPVVVDTLNNRIYVVDSTASGGFRRIDLPGAITPITSDFGTTTEDYVDLGVQTVGGCVGSIDQFRTNDPVIVNAFANSLVDCLTLVVVNNPGSFQTRTTVVLRNFFGTAQYQTLVNSYPGVLTFGSKNPYTRRQAQRGDTRFALQSGNASGATSGATGDYVSPDGKFAFYGSFGFDWGSFDQQGATLGSDFQSFNIVLGGDYEAWDNVYLGGAVSYSGMSSDVSNGTDTQSIDTYNLYLYAVYAEAAAYFQIAMNVGSALQDTTRVSAGNTITGETSGISWGGQIAAGYDFPVTPALSIGPTASLRFATLDMGAYDEVGTGAASIGSQNANALIGSLGGRGLYSLAATDTETVVLNLRAAWETNFKNGAEPVTVAAIGGGAPFQVTPYDSDDSWFNVGGGFTVEGAGYSFYGDFETRLAYEDAEFYFGRFGVRVNY